MTACPTCGEQPRVSATPIGTFVVSCPDCADLGAPVGHGPTRPEAVRDWNEQIAEYELNTL